VPVPVAARLTANSPAWRAKRPATTFPVPDGGGGRGGRVVVFGRPFQHPPDQPDVDRLVFQGAGAGEVDPLRTPPLTRPSSA